MPRNTGTLRKDARKASAKRRQETYDMEYGPVVERAAARGYVHNPRPRKGPKS